MGRAVAQALQAGTLPKGDALGMARAAGILAGKRTAELIPLCHPIPLSQIAVDFAVDAAEGIVDIEARARATARTGVEMEAFTAAAIAAVTLYDMCKGLDPGVEILSIALVCKSGGESGTWQRLADAP